jgi:septal ring factor EnvC (AmiA/AmiB activator)
VRRASLLVTAIGAIAAIAAIARADTDPKAPLAGQIAAEQETLATTIATVDGKLTAADHTHLHRLHAALHIVHATLAPDASAEDRFAAARRRAAARLLLQRDAAERDLLGDEDRRLRAASLPTADQLAAISLPEHLARPVKGTIARHFGSYEHERAHVTLSRRGLDFEVEDHAAAVAPSGGVVRYAGPIRGLDHGVLIDCGDYDTLVAKLGEVATPVGARVGQGDRLGFAQRHRVYLEVRVKLGAGGLPIDPEPLLLPEDRRGPRR